MHAYHAIVRIVRAYRAIMRIPRRRLQELACQIHNLVMEASGAADLAKVAELKNAGNELFMRRQYELANNEYVNALLLLDDILEKERLQEKAPGVG